MKDYFSTKKIDIRSEKVKVAEKIKWLSLYLIFQGLIIGLYNGQNIFAILFTLKKYITYPGLFYLLLHYQPKKIEYYRLFKYIVIICIIQVPISIWQWKTYGGGDNCGGTFGILGQGTGILAILIPPLIGTMLFLFIENKKILFLVVSIILLIPLVVGESKAAFAYIPIVVFYFIFQKYIIKSFTIKNITKAIFYLGCISYIFIKVIGITPEFMNNDFVVKIFSNPDEIVDILLLEVVVDDSYKAGYRVERLASIIYAFDFIQNNYSYLLFGVGPGNISDSFFPSLDGKYSNLPVFRSALVLFIMEWGIIGTISIIFPIVIILRKTSNVKKIITDSFDNSIIIGFEAYILVCILALIYNSVWLYDIIGFNLWVIAAWVYSIEGTKIYKTEKYMLKY